MQSLNFRQCPEAKAYIREAWEKNQTLESIAKWLAAQGYRTVKGKPYNMQAVGAWCNKKGMRRRRKVRKAVKTVGTAATAKQAYNIEAVKVILASTLNTTDKINILRSLGAMR